MPRLQNARGERGRDRAISADIVYHRVRRGVSKRKMGRARTHARRSTNDKIAAPARSICPQCGEVKLPHRVCGNCGYYRDREVIETE